ncbi:Diphthamide biosynthesis protein 2, partial [Coemansia sp. RSA 2607]
NSLVDAKLFDRPVVTPFELLLALSRSREWSGDYITDFRQFLDASEPTAKEAAAAASDHDQDSNQSGAEEEASDEDAPHFSLVTGTLKQRRRYVPAADAAATAGGSDVAVRNNKTEIAQYLGSAAAEHLLTRAFRGLGHDDKEEGEEDAPPMMAVEGRSGIARGYRTAEHQDDRI